MKKSLVNSAGLTVGIFLASFHAIWQILVALKLAKPLMDFMLQLHAIDMQFDILSFNVARAILLVVVTFIIGYIYGAAMACIWQWLKK